jgi:hypothetical protein
MSAWGLGHDAKLDDEVSGEVLWLDLTALFTREADEGGLVVAHDGPGVRAADECAALCHADRRKPVCTLRHEKNPPHRNELIMIVIDVI